MAMKTDYDISEDIRVVQSITGAFTVGDTGTVMTVNANGSVGFPVTYTLKGSLSPKGTDLAGALSFSCKGIGLVTEHDGDRESQEGDRHRYCHLGQWPQLPVHVKRTTKNGVFKLTLTGQHITGITGSLLGQKINFSRL